MINDNFETMSTQILEIQIFVKFLQLHLIYLQSELRQFVENSVAS
jgi:hypothetical protein